MSTISKFDIRISNKPIIKDEEFYYKIWIVKRGTNQRIHFKLYSRLESLKEEKAETIPSLIDVLNMIRSLYIPDDFGDYYEIFPRDPLAESQENCLLRRLEEGKTI